MSRHRCECRGIVTNIKVGRSDIEEKCAVTSRDLVHSPRNYTQDRARTCKLSVLSPRVLPSFIKSVAQMLSVFMDFGFAQLFFL